jgi:hypothetical protein
MRALVHEAWARGAADWLGPCSCGRVMTLLRFSRAALCQRRVAHAVAIAVLLAGCGGAVAPVEGSPSESASPAPSACPSGTAIATKSAVGEACASEGTYCPDPSCDPCTRNCNAVACTHGAWAPAVNTALCTSTSPGESDDAGAPVCISVDPTSYDQSCAVDSDCLEITAGDFCEGTAWCTCGVAAINVAGKASYEQQMNDIQTKLKAGQGGCFCPFLGHPTCVAGACTLCGSPAGGSPGCPDGG